MSGPAVVVARAADGRIIERHGIERRAAPGSTMKPFVLSALLERGGFHAAIPCERVLRIGPRRLDCTHPALPYPVEPASALAYSCNWYFAHVARRLDPAALQRAVGADRLARSAEELQLQALGESGVETTASGLLGAYRRLLMRRSEPNLRPLFQGLEGAVEYGSAQLARVDGLKVAGKTGTTANRSRTSTHAWFAGYAPADAPEIVVVVFLEQGRGGPDAAPVAAGVFKRWHRSRK